MRCPISLGLGLLILLGPACSYAAVSQRLAALIKDHPEMGFKVEARGVVSVSPYRPLISCQTDKLENFAAQASQGDMDEAMLSALAGVLGVSASSRDFQSEYTVVRGARRVLNGRGQKYLGEKLLSSCGAERDTRDVEPAVVGVNMPNAADPAELQAAVKDPEALFDGKGGKAVDLEYPSADKLVSCHSTQRSPAAKTSPLIGVPLVTQQPVKTEKGPPPVPELSRPEPPLDKRTWKDDAWDAWSRFSDVRAARAQWKKWDIPVVSAVMGSMAGIIQFAQDDAAIAGYYGVTSKEGMKAVAHFSFNTFAMAVTVPGAANAATHWTLNAASKMATGGTKIIGNYKLLARFTEVPGIGFTKVEPVWVGVEKVVAGSAHGAGIVHLGVTVGQGGAHVGLNFLGGTHVYMSHVYVAALKAEAPNIVFMPVANSFIGVDNKLVPCHDGINNDDRGQSQKP